MKGKTIGYYKNVQNVPYCKAAVAMNVGMGVILDRENATAALPADATEAKSCVYVVSNITDKPEIRNSNAFAIAAGEFVRADDLRTVNGIEVEIAQDELTAGATTYAAITAGTSDLVFGTDGKLAVAGDTTGYAVYFHVLEKTAYMGAGLRAEIVVA